VGFLETGLKYRNSDKEPIHALLKSRSNWSFSGGLKSENKHLEQSIYVKSGSTFEKEIQLSQ
jgi:hypothetical protein